MNFSKTNKRWLISLNEIKEYFNNNNTTRCLNAFRDRRLHGTWHSFLLNNKVIIKNESGYYKWKENIPVSKKLIDKYREYRDFNKQITRQRQTTLPSMFSPPPHYIKDAIKGTVTVVPQGKEKEFIESTKVAQPQQRREFSFGWGFINIKF